MKNIFKQSQLLSELLLKQKTVLTESLSVKGGLGLVKYILPLYSVAHAKAPTKSDVRVIKHFCRSVYLLNRDSGPEFLIKYLKTSAALLQQYCGRQKPVTNPRLIAGAAVSVTRCGLPRIIPRVQRRLIRKGDPIIISYWLSVLNLYRYIICKHKAFSPKTITGPFTGDPAIFARFLPYVENFWRHLGVHRGQALKEVKGKGTAFLSDKVSALISRMSGVTGTSYEAVMKAVWAWRGLAESQLSGERSLKDSRLLSSFNKVMDVTFPSLKDTMFPVITASEPEGLEPVVTFHMQPFTYFWRQRTGPKLPTLKDAALGRLVALKEAAGKLRTVAIVDPLTQWILRPVHLWIFRILSKISEDGTFDQLKAVLSFSSGSKWRFVSKATSCLDLSAATDRLPVKLQVMLLSYPFSPSFARAWASLLTDRAYVKSFTPYFYAVGQPMGALSSWASLAITHHFMWQVAAWSSGVIPLNRWYDKYRVLGDDSTARIRPIWERYLELCQGLGVGISLPKSLMSPIGCIEFAKKFITPRGNASPISLGELTVARVCFPVAVGLLKKYPHIRLVDVLRLYGYKFRTLGGLNQQFAKLPKKARNIVIVATSPWGPRPCTSMVNWLSVTALGGKRREMEWGLMTVELLLLVDKLWYKAQLIRDRHKSDRRFSFLDCLATSHQARILVKADPDLQKSLYATVYKPLGDRTAKDADQIVKNIRALRNAMCRRNFQTQDFEFEEFWKEYLKQENLLDNLRSDCFQQEIDEEDLIPSARKVLALYNRFNISAQVLRRSVASTKAKLKRDEKRKVRKVEKPWVFKSYHDMVGRY